jgi:hypothetical protein
MSPTALAKPMMWTVCLSPWYLPDLRLVRELNTELLARLRVDLEQPGDERR